MKRIYLDLSDEKSGVTGTNQLFAVHFPGNTDSVNGYTNNLSFMVDCGSFQGSDEEEALNSSFSYDVSIPEFGILTHCHLDHYGRYPFAIKKGFQGAIFTTYVTKSFLSQVFLDDCLRIETKRAKKEAKKLEDETGKEVEPDPLYTEVETKKMKDYMIPCAYHKRIKYNENICIYFFDNGHVPGAAVTLIQLTYPGYEEINIVISGDYNDHNTFFKVNPLPAWVYDLPNVTIIIESTYGDTSIKDLRPACFAKNIVKALSQNKTCVVPAFSFVRTQEVNYALKEAQDLGRLSPSIPIYNDGKTAIGCTDLFLNGEFKMYPHMKEFMPENVTFVDNKELRRFLKHDGTPKIIVASSGMGSYGPSQAYIEAYLNNPNSIIHATGYLSPDSKLGRIRDEGDYGTTFLDTDEFSAHGKLEDLKKFVEPFYKGGNLKSVLITHGSSNAKEEFKNELLDSYDVNVAILSNDNIFRITSDGIVKVFPKKTTE